MYMYMCEGGCKASTCRRGNCVWVSGMNGGRKENVESETVVVGQPSERLHMIENKYFQYICVLSALLLEVGTP